MPRSMNSKEYMECGETELRAEIRGHPSHRATADGKRGPNYDGWPRFALLVQRFIGRRLKEAALDLSPVRAVQALSTVRVITFRLDGQPLRRGVSGGCPDARKVLKALKIGELRPPTPPEGEETIM